MGDADARLRRPRERVRLNGGAEFIALAISPEQDADTIIHLASAHDAAKFADCSAAAHDGGGSAGRRASRWREPDFSAALHFVKRAR